MHIITSAAIISCCAMLLIFSGSDSCKWNVKAESFNSPGTKGSEIANPREKMPDGIRRKSQFWCWCQSVEDNCKAYLSSLLWGLNTCSKQVSMWQMLVWITKEYFYKKMCVFDKISQHSKGPRLNLKSFNFVFQSPPLPPPKSSPQRKRAPDQLMAFMTQIEICIWNHKIMQNQEPQSEKYRKNCLGKQGTKQHSWKYFSFTWTGGSSGTLKEVKTPFRELNLFSCHKHPLS